MFSAYRELVYLKLLLPLIAGILLAVYYNVPVYFPMLAVIVGTAVIMWFNWTKTTPASSLSREWKSGLAINLLVLALGYLVTYAHHEIQDHSHFSRYYLQKSEWVAQLTEPPTLQDSSYRIKADVVTVFQAKKGIGTAGKVIIYLPQDSKSSQLKYGDLIGLSAPIKETSKAANPYEFDRKTYFAWQQYYHQATAYPNQWKPLEINRGNAFFKGMYGFRERYLTRLSNYLQGEALAVTASLLLGYRDFMDNELTQNYSAAGVVHILSVSGMHLGLVVLVMTWLLSLVRIPEKYRWIEFLLIVLAVWAFACLTGLAPSVLRAAVIATFLLIGKLLRRDMHPLNGLAASAFFLFIINPFLLFDIGFQLSYLAVAGILLMYPTLYKQGYIKSWLPDKIYQSIVLSLSATIATLPLTFYYFHQASVYFAFSNLVVVPLSALIMASGTLLLLLSPFNALAHLAAIATKWLVIFMNKIIAVIAHLPFAQIKGIALMKEEIILLGIALGLLALFIYSGRTKLLLASLMVFIGFFCYGINNQQLLPLQSKLVVYCIKRHNAIDLIEGKQDILLADDSLFQNQNVIDQHISPMRWYAGLGEAIVECTNEDTSKFQWQSMWRDGKYLQIHNKRILLLSHWKRLIPPRNKLQVDYLILTHNAQVNIHELALSIQPKMVIIDAANSIRKSESIIDQCKDIGWKYYDTRSEGAWMLDFNPTLSRTHQ